MWSIPVGLLDIQGSTPVLAAWLVAFSRSALVQAEGGPPTYRRGANTAVVTTGSPAM